MAGELREGTSLARLALQTIDLSRGTFRLPIPEALAQDDSFELSSGNVRLNGDEEEDFSRVVRTFVSTPGCALIMQDDESKPSDPGLRELPYYRFAVAYGTEVYWRVAGTELGALSVGQILDVVYSASHFPWTGFFYRNGISSEAGELTSQDLEHVVTNLVGIAVSALDYRSYLIWWRDDLQPFPTTSA